MFWGLIGRKTPATITKEIPNIGANAAITPSQEQLDQILLQAGQQTISKIVKLKYHGSREWSTPLKEARHQLEEPGFTEVEQHHLLRPTYEMAIPYLIQDREDILNISGWKQGDSYWRCDEIAELYRLIGDEDNAIAWELTFCQGRAYLLDISICEFPKRIEEENRRRKAMPGWGPRWTQIIKGDHEKHLLEQKTVCQRILEIKTLLREKSLLLSS